VLYLSRYIIRHKHDYYRLLQQVRNNNDWESWLLFMLEAVAVTAAENINTTIAIREAMQQYKENIRSNLPKIYSQDLLNNLFSHPYTKIEYIMNDLQVSRGTAVKYLEELVKLNLLMKQKIGRDSYYVNKSLFDVLIKNNS
jgi:Fic family protein